MLSKSLRVAFLVCYRIPPTLVSDPKQKVLSGARTSRRHPELVREIFSQKPLYDSILAFLISWLYLVRTYEEVCQSPPHLAVLSSFLTLDLRSLKSLFHQRDCRLNFFSVRGQLPSYVVMTEHLTWLAKTSNLSLLSMRAICPIINSVGTCKLKIRLHILILLHAINSWRNSYLLCMSELPHIAWCEFASLPRILLSVELEKSSHNDRRAVEYVCEFMILTEAAQMSWLTYSVNGNKLILLVKIMHVLGVRDAEQHRVLPKGPAEGRLVDLSLFIC